MELTIIQLFTGCLLLVFPSILAGNTGNYSFKKLNVKTYPESQEVDEHNDAVFDCRDESDEHAPIRWIRENNMPLPTTATVKNGNRLAIYGVRKEDAGVYICEGIDPHTGSTLQQVRVTLNLKKKHIQPNLKIYPEDRRIFQNQDASFDCFDEREMRIPVNWRRGNNLPLPQNTEVVGDRIKFSRVQLQDAGEYVCEEMNSSPYAPKKYVKFTLEVVPSSTSDHGSYLKTPAQNFVATTKPVEAQLDQLDLRVYSENRVITENEDVAFVCRDESNQHASVTWQRGGNIPLPSDVEITNGWIKIRRVQLHDAGEYFCEANGYSQSTRGQRVKFNLVIRKAPRNYQFSGQGVPESGERKLKIHPRYPLVKPHSSVTLTCNDENDLPVFVNWRRGSNALLPEGAIVENGSLTIPDVKLEDSGFYICETTSPSTLGQSVDVILLVEKPEEEPIVRLYDLE